MTDDARTRIRIESLDRTDPQPLRIETGGHTVHDGDRIGAVELTRTALLTRQQLEDTVTELRDRLARCECGV